jgi:hypothetical protein
MTIDQFLAQAVLVIEGKKYSVKDVIKFAANVAGAVHHDPKAKPEFVAQKKYSELFRIGGFPAGIRQLRAIARVTLKALEPLLVDLVARP